MSELNYHKAELMREWINELIQTLECMLDTGDFMPPKMQDIIITRVCKGFLRDWKKIGKAARKYQKQLNKQLAEEEQADESKEDSPNDQPEKALVPVVEEVLPQA